MDKYFFKQLIDSGFKKYPSKDSIYLKEQGDLVFGVLYLDDTYIKLYVADRDANVLARVMMSEENDTLPKMIERAMTMVIMPELLA